MPRPPLAPPPEPLLRQAEPAMTSAEIMQLQPEPPLPPPAMPLTPRPLLPPAPPAPPAPPMPSAQTHVMQPAQNWAMESAETHVMQPAQNWALRHLMQLQAVQVLDVAARERLEYTHASALHTSCAELGRLMLLAASGPEDLRAALRLADELCQPGRMRNPSAWIMRSVTAHRMCSGGR